MQTLTPTRAWQRVLKQIALYGGNQNIAMYQRYKNNQNAIGLVQQLLTKNASFTARNSAIWCYWLCGTFNVTHKQFIPPAQSNTHAAKQLASCVQTIIA